MKERGLRGIKLFLPGKKEPIERPNQPIEEILKTLVETPERLFQTFRQINTFVSGEKFENQRVESHIQEGERYRQTLKQLGYSDTTADIMSIVYAGSLGVIDATIVGSLVRSGARAVLRNVAIPDVEYQVAYKSLGMPKTIQEAEQTARNLLRDVSPNSSRAQRLGTVNERVAQVVDDSLAILRKEGIKRIPTKVETGARDIARILESDVRELAEQGFRLGKKL